MTNPKKNPVSLGENACKNQTEKTPAFQSGYVVLIGVPNAGKSTFINRVLGEKISITSKKPQTTRNRILGILHRPNAQIVFMDTPGIIRGETMFNARLVSAARSALTEADLVLMLLDASAPDPASEEVLLASIRSGGFRVLLAFNKIDAINPKQLLPLTDHWAGAYPFEAVFSISALKGTGVETLLCALEKRLLPGPRFFDEDAVTDMPTRFLVAERIREKVFRLTGKEIPYATAVTVEAFSQSQDKPFVKIRATIHVERDSQKGIVIGKSGQKLKQIGTGARKEIEAFLGCRVFLELFVRVQKNWRKDEKALKQFGFP